MNSSVVPTNRLISCYFQKSISWLIKFIVDLEMTNVQNLENCNKKGFLEINFETPNLYTKSMCQRIV